VRPVGFEPFRQRSVGVHGSPFVHGRRHTGDRPNQFDRNLEGGGQR
jgi:hypothetical protein